MNDKSSVAAKVRALLAKTVENGCTEAEAMAAAIKAKALMDEYQIDLSEYDLEQEGCITGVAGKPKPSRFNIQSSLGCAVADFCECKVWASFDSRGLRRSDKRITFFGLRSDVEFANWLLVALESFVWINANQFEERDRMLNGPDAGGYYARRNFMMGCCKRINERLREEIAKRKPVTASGGRSVMVIKGAIVAREFNKLGMHLGSNSRGSYRQGGSLDAFAEGFKAGDKAGFGRPVGGSGETLKIGRS